MSRFLSFLFASLFLAPAFGQADSSGNPRTSGDTTYMGNLIIIKKANGRYESHERGIPNHHSGQARKNSSTNWLIVDLGFANYTDHTDYGAAAAAGVVQPGLSGDQFKLRTGKSLDVNIWLFMQRINLISRVVNLKYGLGIELNNYRYETPILYNKTTNLFTTDPARHYSKDKLAADYVTIPVMLNVNLTPGRSYNHSVGFSAGVSAGYLYSSRQKMVTAEDGKQKIHADMYLRPFKISYVGELQLGPLKLFGSLATRSMFEKGLDQTPWNAGVRLSNW